MGEEGRFVSFSVRTTSFRVYEPKNAPPPLVGFIPQSCPGVARPCVGQNIAPYPPQRNGTENQQSRPKPQCQIRGVLFPCKAGPSKPWGWRPPSATTSRAPPGRPAATTSGQRPYSVPLSRGVGGLGSKQRQDHLGGANARVPPISGIPNHRCGVAEWKGWGCVPWLAPPHRLRRRYEYYIFLDDDVFLVTPQRFEAMLMKWRPAVGIPGWAVHYPQPWGRAGPDGPGSAAGRAVVLRARMPLDTPWLLSFVCHFRLFVNSNPFFF